MSASSENLLCCSRGFVPVIIVVLFTVGVTLPVAAQPNSASFKRMTPEEGLSQSAVYAMTQDRWGYLWLGTQDGLNRYDGYRFTVFAHDALDSLDETLLQSLKGAREALRGSERPATSLAQARDRMEAHVDDVRREIAAGWAPDAEEGASVLVRIDAARRLCARQLAVKAWLADWRQARHRVSH